MEKRYAVMKWLIVVLIDDESREVTWDDEETSGAGLLSNPLLPTLAFRIPCYLLFQQILN